MRPPLLYQTARSVERGGIGQPGAGTGRCRCSGEAGADCSDFTRVAARS